jgi:hypothetical protein
VLHRLLLVRTAGFYIEQNAAFLIVPNLFFLRFIIPPIAEETTMAYVDDPKMKRIASLLTGSLLSLCNELGWPEDKEPYMTKFNNRMHDYYLRFEEFTLRLIDCNDWEYDTSRLNPKGNMIDIIASAAERVILLDHKETNKVLRSHMYCASLMHMIEENVYDFTGVGPVK